MKIRLDEQIKALKYRRSVMRELWLRGHLQQDDYEIFDDSITNAIMVIEDLFKTTKRNEYELN